tara:strand:- start:358 stop:645 length:288 start_codon:yes stop_codon:yes gene_type:complete
MSESLKDLDLLESNIEKLKMLVIKLKEENIEINQDLNKKRIKISDQKNELNDYKKKYESLKIASTFLSKNDKSLTKSKINKMIKELDQCIMNLSF